MPPNRRRSSSPRSDVGPFFSREGQAPSSASLDKRWAGCCHESAPSAQSEEALKTACSTLSLHRRSLNCPENPLKKCFKYEKMSCNDVSSVIHSFSRENRRKEDRRRNTLQWQVSIK